MTQQFGVGSVFGTPLSATLCLIVLLSGVVVHECIAVQPASNDLAKQQRLQPSYQSAPPPPWTGKCVEGQNRKLMTLHVQDVSELVEPSLMTMIATQVLPEYAVNTDFSFTEYNAMSLAKFSNKRQYTRNMWDTCWNVVEQVGEPSLDVQDAYRKLVSNFVEHLFVNPSLSGGADRGAQYDALYAAAKLGQWTTLEADSNTNRVVFLYTHRLPQLPEDGLYNHKRLIRKLSYDDPAQCDSWDSVPTAEEIVQALADRNINVVFMIKQQHIPVYKQLFKPALEAVTGAPYMYYYPLTNDHGESLNFMMNAIDLIACNEPQSSDGVTSRPTVVPDTLPERTCGSQVHLQLLHLQDISHSYSNDMDKLRTTYTDLIHLLREDFDTLELALGHFRDKNISPLGDAYDTATSCFTESVGFSDNSTAFESTLSSFRPDGGGDWKESQYDALLHGTASDSLGWHRAAEHDGRVVVRIAMVATDSGPHVHGDRLNAPAAVVGQSCATTDYPTASMVGQHLEALDTYPLFVVTSDIFGYWLREAEDVIPSATVGVDGPVAYVVPLAGGPSAVFDAIKNTVNGICRHSLNRRRV
eukprot:Lankesteria_metandrocarpae@DN5313_c0_g1_i1.p1